MSEISDHPAPNLPVGLGVEKTRYALLTCAGMEGGEQVVEPSEDRLTTVRFL